MKDIVKVKLLDNNILAVKLNRPIEVDETKKYEIDLKEYKSKRSLEQNSYLWLLITEICKKENAGKHTQEELINTYCNLLEKASAKFEFILCPKEALSEFKKRFRAVRQISTYEIKNVVYEQIQVFYGSSTMNTKEMSHLIDCVLDYASELEIENLETYWKELLKGGK